MSSHGPQRPLVIRRVRITGLAGPAPTAEAVRSALAEALRGEPDAASATGTALRHGATLDEAARSAAAIVRRRTR